MPELSEAFSLAGEVALITGGGTGLGLGVASTFVAAGARVVLVGRKEPALASAVERLGAQATYALHDVSDSDRAGALIERVTERQGQVSILVNNAGVHLKKSVTETTENEFHALFHIHVLGAFALTRAVVPQMMARGKGSVLFMASMASLIGLPNVVAYSAAKSAYLGMVRGMAAELSSQGVRVNAIAPGFIETPMLHKAVDHDPERKRRILERTPMGRFGEASDIGWAAVYLCSPAARFVTGVVLPVDGGASVGF